MPLDSDTEMAPVQVIDTGNPKQGEQHHHQVACEQSEDVHMECKATAIDSDGNTPHETTRAPQPNNDNGHDHNTSAANVDLTKNTPLQHNNSPPKQDVRNNHLSSTNTVTGGQSQLTVGTFENHNEVANVGSPRSTPINLNTLIPLPSLPTRGPRGWTKFFQRITLLISPLLRTQKVTPQILPLLPIPQPMSHLLPS
jgi:hypothetical protein